MIDLLLGLTLFGHFAWFAIIIIAWLIGLFWSEYEKQGWFATAFTAILITIFYFDSSTQLFNYFSWGALGIYIASGFIYSLIKTFLFARKEQTKFLKMEAKWGIQLEKYVKSAKKQNSKMSEDDIKSHRESLERNRSSYDKYEKESVSKHVFRWWFLWPISLISWIFTDLVKDIYDFMWRYLKGFYNRIVTFAEGTVKLDADE